jgi:hypothetical protein
MGAFDLWALFFYYGRFEKAPIIYGRFFFLWAVLSAVLSAVLFLGLRFIGLLISVNF